MPIITVLVSAARSPELTRELAATLHERTVHTLRKRADLIAITIQYIDPADWVIAGRTLADQDRRSAFVDIRVTDETNTKDEKARFIAEVYGDLQRLLGDLHEETYIHVHDVRGTAYGYGGRTQDARYHDAPR